MLDLPFDFPLPGVNPTIADDDAMFDGRHEHYVSVGFSADQAILRAVQGRPSPRRILDMPCGHGRVTRMLRARWPAASVTVCDLDRSGVDFSASQFDARGIYSQDDFRTLELGEQYELIWVGSLVTHLSEQQTRRFLDFAARHLAPAGTLVFSSHGAFAARRLRSYQYGLSDYAAQGLLADATMSGYGYRCYQGSKHYGISLVRESWYRELFAEGPFRLVGYDEQGWDEHQDVVTVHRAAETPFGETQGFFERLRGREFRAPYRYDLHSIPPLSPVEQEAIDQTTLTGFDEAWYLAADPVVADATARQVFASGLEHYRCHGWREGRPFCPPSATYDARCRTSPAHRETTATAEVDAFDEAYYRATYPDVAQAIARGLFASGRDHFESFGRSEKRFPSPRFEADLLSLSIEERQTRVADVWSQDAEKDPGWYWMAHPAVRTRLNRLSSGNPDQDSYDRLLVLLSERGFSVPIGRAVSLGCGFGGLERDLSRRGIITEIDAYDIAPGAIAEARRLAKETGLSGVRYHVSDLEHVQFAAATVDVVFAHQSVHHVERLDELFAAVSAMLRPGGVFHLHEFVGPTRFQWTNTQIKLVNEFIGRLPARLRALPSGAPRPLQSRASVAQMIAADPSEAVRSADIMPTLARWFNLIEHRPLGGALLHLGLGGIAQNFDTSSTEDMAILESFFAEEDAAMHQGLIGSDFTVITAAKRGA